MKEDLLQIIQHYGINHQQRKFQEEVFELNEVIIKERELYSNGGTLSYHNELKQHITEEIADVMVMLKQFQYYYEISDKEIEEVMQSKINRQIERIKNGE